VRHPDEGRDHGFVAEAGGRGEADEREASADQRDRIADEREASADQRDRIADEREASARRADWVAEEPTNATEQPTNATEQATNATEQPTNAKPEPVGRWKNGRSIVPLPLSSLSAWLTTPNNSPHIWRQPPAAAMQFAGSGSPRLSEKSPVSSAEMRRGSVGQAVVPSNSNPCPGSPGLRPPARTQQARRPPTRLSSSTPTGRGTDWPA